METILFQGDSITYSGRNYELDHLRGFGYSTMATGNFYMTIRANLKF